MYSGKLERICCIENTYQRIDVLSSLATNRDDIDGATSKGCAGNNEAKQSLAEYASLYREYQQIEKCIKDGNYEPDMERRKNELSKELADREEHIRKVSDKIVFFYFSARWCQCT